MQAENEALKRRTTQLEAYLQQHMGVVSDLASTPADEVLDMYMSWFKQNGGRRKGIPPRKSAVNERRGHCEDWIARLGLETLADLRLTDVEAQLSEMAEDYQTNTLYNRATSLRAFVRWAFRREYLGRNPIADLSQSIRQELDRGGKRALTDDELSMLKGAAQSKEQKNRLLVYLVAVATGFRSGELHWLQTSDFDGKTLRLSAEHAKDRKPAAQCLPRKLAKRLRTWAKARGEGALFDVPRWHASDMISPDYEAAKITGGGTRLAFTAEDLRHDAGGRRPESSVPPYPDISRPRRAQHAPARKSLRRSSLMAL